MSDDEMISTEDLIKNIAAAVYSLVVMATDKEDKDTRYFILTNVGAALITASLSFYVDNYDERKEECDNLLKHISDFVVDTKTSTEKMKFMSKLLKELQDGVA